ncbi:Cullin family-domain-containing protein [Leucosporidium creatinivorum]|uniref:Cullin family-domain-containing protein n=1 Tax=Leucosporidium creatinivorum TaxID=106004 RepID=A0A1Y2EHG7_9BASI|nr:Cullin family-domain-containing protein [Leucosporidium creatinivorum]
MSGLSGSPPRKLAKMDPADDSTTSLCSGHPVPKNGKPVAPPPGPPPASSTKKRLGLATGLEKAGSKKLVLKPKARTSTPSSSTSHPDASSYLQQSLVTLTRATRAILTTQPTPESLQALYTLCENAVSNGAATAQTLYDRIRLEVERQTVEVRKELVNAGDESEETWLGRWETTAKRYLEQVLLIRSVFLHLDRTYVLKEQGLLSLWEMGLDQFRHAVVENEAVATRTTAGLLSLVQKERDGDLIPRPLLSSIITLLTTFSSHSLSTLFTTPFLTSTRQYFKLEAARLAAELEPSDYLKQINRRLGEEGERCESVIGGDVKGSVLRVVLEEMVTGHVEAIVEKALGTMITEERKEDLTSLYALLNRVSNLAVLRMAFLEHIKSTGLSVVLDTTADDKMVVRLIALRQSSLQIVEQCFSADSSFAQSVSQAFEVFINKRENKPAEMMAKFLDAKLRSGNRGMDDATLEATLNDVLFLFRFTQGKDIFEAFYKRDLAKRLLLNKSASFDAERSMLLKLKDECGPGFTTKLEIMFKDIELSDDIMRAYNGSNSNSNSSCSDSHPFDLSVSILSTGNWPTYPITPLSLPPSMSTTLDRFKSFYTSKYSGRTITWAHQLDTCAVRAVFPKSGGEKRPKELAVSLWQTVVLLLFNAVPEGGMLGFKEIVEMTRLEPKEAARTLQSLACGKVRVLQKHPKGREVDEGDQFSFNSNFKDDHIKIKINQIQQTATPEENKETSERVFTDRSSHLQLAIVRIMKARKTLKYNELIMEVVKQIGARFKVEPAEIKKSISSLIDREYMRRKDGELNVFEYVA